MSDISKCEGKNCRVQEQCWRYMAPAGHWQSYIIGEYDLAQNCEMFWPMEAPPPPVAAGEEKEE